MNCIINNATLDSNTKTLEQKKEIALRKKNACHRPAIACHAKQSGKQIVYGQTCKQTYLCEYCANRFQNEFANSVQHLAKYAKSNSLRLSFLTLTFSPIEVSNYEEETQTQLHDLLPKLTTFFRLRIQKETRQKLFYSGVFSFAQNGATPNQIDLQWENFLSMEEILPNKDARITHLIPKCLVRLEIKQQDDTTIFPHLHLYLAHKGYLCQPFISQAWKSVTGSRVVDIREIKENDLEQIAEYGGKSQIADYGGKTEGNKATNLSLLIQACLYGKHQKRWLGHDKTKLLPEKQHNNIFIGTVSRKKSLEICSIDNDEIKKPEIGEVFEVSTEFGAINCVFTSEEKQSVFCSKKTNNQSKEQLKSKYRLSTDITEYGSIFFVFHGQNKWECEPSTDMDFYLLNKVINHRITNK